MLPQLHRRLERKLNDEGYSCETFCNDLPYTFWNTCPLCLCGLMPVVIVCFSAMFRLDYATHVTDLGAKIINDMGLSYTVYYTAGCWPHGTASEKLVDASALKGSYQRSCNEDHFEIAAGEFDALSGSLLRVRNVTQLKARRVDAVKVTPDWRFITFVGILPIAQLNVWVVGAEQHAAKRATPLLTEEHLATLEARCRDHAAQDLRSWSIEGEDGATDKANIAASVRLSGFQHLQVIIPQASPPRSDGELIAATERRDLAGDRRGMSPTYRAAFAFQCELTAKTAITFSKLAILDFKLQKRNVTTSRQQPGGGQNGVVAEAFPLKYLARSELRFVDTAAATAANDAVGGQRFYNSQSCPRFVPSSRGERLLFVLEDFVGRPAQAGFHIRRAETSVGGGKITDEPASSALLGRRLALVAFHAAEQTVPTSGATEHRGLPQARGLGTSNDEGIESDGNYSTSVLLEGSHTNPVVDVPEPLSKCCKAMTAECLACERDLPMKDFCSEPSSARIVGCEGTRKRGTGSNDLRDSWHSPHQAEEEAKVKVASVLEHTGMEGRAVLLDVGTNALPVADVHGCPEFVPSLYFASETLQDTLSENLFSSPESRAKAKLEERKLQDTFVFETDPNSISVLGVAAQVLGVELPDSPLTGAVRKVRLLYNVDSAPSTFSEGGGSRLRIGGCKPIRAVGRVGHFKLQRALETLMNTLKVETEQNGYTAWLACLTTDQRVAIVESPKREHWINMSMPYPIWTGKPSQAIWCPESRAEACFEVWSNPNPNE